ASRSSGSFHPAQWTLMPALAQWDDRPMYFTGILGLPCRFGGTHRGERARSRSAALVGADQPVHAEDVRLDLLEELPKGEAGLERGVVAQGEHPKVVVVDTMTLGGKGTGVADLVRVVLPRRMGGGPLLEPVHRRRDVVEHPVHVAIGAVGGDEGRVRIMADDREGTGALGGIAPGELRRDVLSLAGVLLGNGATGAESCAAKLHLGRGKTHRIPPWFEAGMAGRHASRSLPLRAQRGR